MDPVSSADIFLFDRFRFDRRGGGLFYIGDSTPIALGSRALDVLNVLIERAGDLVSKDEIMQAVWPGTTVEEANLTVQISTLRRVLDNGRSETSCIQTIPGRGYRFVARVTRQALGLSPGLAMPSQDRGKGEAPVQPLLSTVSNIQQPASRHWLREVRSTVAMLFISFSLVLVGSAMFWASDYRWPGQGPATLPRLSIVVLPFTNLSDDREQQYFADGLTEDLTTDLSLITDLVVISRNTAVTYKGKIVNAKQIGRELGVRYVLDGSVRRSGKQMRVNVQLIDAENNAHVWADRFDSDTGDLFAMQNEITGRLANSLGLALIRREAGRPVDNPDVLEYSFQARAAAANPPSREKYATAIKLFEQVLALDPHSADTQGRLAIQLTARVLDQMTDTPAADMTRAEELIAQALTSSPHNLPAHYAKGQLLRVQRRCAEAISEYDMVLAYNRNNANGLSHMARCKMYLALPEEAIPLLERAMRLSPRDPDSYAFYELLGRAHLLQSRVDAAIVWLEKSRAIASPGYPFVHAYLAAAYGLKGETDRAATEVAQARKLGGGAFSSIARIRSNSRYETPAGRALNETTYFTGLRQAGMPDE